MKLANFPNRSWHSYESSPSLRVPDNVIHKPSLDGQAMSKKWSGWQELNLRGHVPKTCGWPLPYTRILVARHGIEPYPLAFQTSTLPSSSRAKVGGRCET